MGATEVQGIRSAIPSPHYPELGLTSFIGRQAEVEAANDRLARHRLVTLTGPGGAGKTRLAAEVAAARADRHPDGVWWIDLTTISDDAAVAETIAEAMAVPILSGRPTTLIAPLRTWRALLCLDNAEHLLDGVASTVVAVLQGCPGITVLVTSREPLGVSGEAVLDVPPLSDDDALSLFVDRARLVQPAFALDPANEAAIRSITAHLDGMPLAIELAASWARTLTAQQVESGLDERFTLLVRGPRGAQRRQRTLWGSIDWSHALLDETDRIVLRRLAVFAGTFGVDAAQKVCADATVSATEVLHTLGRLVDKSLVVAEQRSGESRFRLLNTIRAYAAGRLAEAAEDREWHERHLAWCLAFVRVMEPDRESDADRWRQQLQLEYDNLRAALDWGLAAERPDLGRELAASLAWLWHLDHRGQEGVGFLRRAIDRAPAQRSPLQARLLTGLALVLDTAGPIDLEYDAALRAVELAGEVGDDDVRALGLMLLAVGSFYTDFDEAWRQCEQAHAAALAGRNNFVLGGTRALQAMILHLRDRHPEAEALADEATCRRLRHHRGVLSTLLTYQADGALACGDPARALELAGRALQLAEPLGDYLRVGLARAVLARIATLTGDPATAAEVAEPVLRLIEGSETEVFIPGLDQAVAALAMVRDDPEKAVTWLQRTAGSTDRGVPTWLACRALPRLGDALAAADRLAEAAEAYQKAVEIARRLDMPGPLADAYTGLARLAAAEPDGHPRAVKLHHAALTIRVDHGLRTAQLDTLESLSSLAAATGPTLDDVRTLQAADSVRATTGLPRLPDQQRTYDQAVAILRQTLGESAFDRAADEGARLTLDEAVGLARRTRGRRGRPASGWASLTPTELEVVRLASTGLTNPQIGTRLFMSRSTVKTHLAHIYAKLGTANRTELATHRRGSLPAVAGLDDQ